MIADYEGTVVLIVSHDRDFLDRTVGSIIMAEGDGRFVEYAGGYSDMVAQRREGRRCEGCGESGQGRGGAAREAL